MPFPSWITAKAAGAVGAVVLLAAAFGYVANQLKAERKEGYQTGYAKAQAEYRARALVESERAREQERQAAADIAKLEGEARARQKDHERVLGAARAELDRLRDMLANAGRPAASGHNGATAASGAASGRRDDAPAAAVVAGQCAAELVALAEAADTVRLRLITLQAWVRKVPQHCVASMAD